MNPALRKALRGVLYRGMKVATEIAYLLPRGGLRIPVLVYHRVCPLRYRKAFTYANVYPAEFAKQMAFVSVECEALTVSEFLDRAAEGGLRGNEVCLTFDDGFRDNYIYAMPILEQYGLKASFFLATASIGSERVFPWMALDSGARQDMAIHPERWLPLSWSEVREMREKGMEFGTHTHTHRAALLRMTDEEAWKELKTCTEVFTSEMGGPPQVFSYPHGTSRDYSASHAEMLRTLGYRAALTTNIGRNGPEQDPFHLKRLIVYEEDSLREVRKKVGGAYDVVGMAQRLWLRAAGSVPVKEQMEGAAGKGPAPGRRTPL